jgi:hypothetical protein
MLANLAAKAKGFCFRGVVSLPPLRWTPLVVSWGCGFAPCRLPFILLVEEGFLGSIEVRRRIAARTAEAV